MEFVKSWLEAFMNGFEKHVDEDARSKVFEECGKICSSRYLVNVAKGVKNEMGDITDIDEMINWLNRHWIVGKLKREGNTIFSEYRGGDCTCPVCKQGYITLKSFGACCTANLKERFDIILGKPVQIKMVTAEFRGDERCSFEITLHDEMLVP